MSVTLGGRSPGYPRRESPGATLRAPPAAGEARGGGLPKVAGVVRGVAGLVAVVLAPVHVLARGTGVGDPRRFLDVRTPGAGRPGGGGQGGGAVEVAAVVLGVAVLVAAVP